MVAGAVSSSAQRGAPAWDVIVGDRFIAAVGAPAPEAVLAALAEAAGDPDPTVERLVGLVPIGRADPVGSFALVWWPADTWTEVTAVVRGDAVVDLDSPGGSRRFDARGSRPWLLADFHDVIAVRLTGVEAALLPVGAAVDPVPHARASVRASSIEWTLARPSQQGAPGAPGAPGSTRPTIAAPPIAHADPDVAADTVLVRRRVADADTVLAAPPRHVEADTILTPRASRRRRGDRPVQTPLTVDLDGVPSTRRALGDPGGAGTPSMHDGADAAASADLAARDPRPRATGSSLGRAKQTAADPPAAARVPAPVPPPGAPRFRVGEGPERVFTAPVLIGRRPMPPRVAGLAGPPPELVTVESPGSVVSGTHLELRLEGTRLVATDLRSTNGTTVHTAAGARRMRAGESVVVTPGSRLDLGDDTIVEILPAPGTSIE
ncbi:FHA domain-containing protein [Agromyces ramosus]|uniref:FHA domain-containing protein n=1 Tax=Agromyces ramosus TaxID=33879 RepID=A0ABU0RBU7_9MICO|nr:FHA domain-containing protein [Agromyces ramosus]MDQ0895547.1 hypothetical protein [Agromyces ramosus]